MLLDFLKLFATLRSLQIYSYYNFVITLKAVYTQSILEFGSLKVLVCEVDQDYLHLVIIKEIVVNGECKSTLSASLFNST